jgi:hypothetical protein
MSVSMRSHITGDQSVFGPEVEGQHSRYKAENE